MNQIKITKLLPKGGKKKDNLYTYRIFPIISDLRTYVEIKQLF